MTVHLAGALPSNEFNGLLTHERRLIEGRHEDKSYVVIGRVTVGGAKEKAPDWKPEPIMRVEHVEIVPNEMSQDAYELLLAAYQARTGKVTLDGFAGSRPTDQPQPLQLTSVQYVFSVSVDSERPDRFDLELITDTGAVVGKRSGMVAADFPGVTVGDFEDVADLPGSLRRLAEALVSELASEDGVIDVEVVEDEGSEQ